jgi:hypothetical protein
MDRYTPGNSFAYEVTGFTNLVRRAAERYGISDLEGYEPKSLRGIYGGPHPAFDIQ